MKLYDITHELFSGPVYPGDPAPVLQNLSTIGPGEDYNLSAFSACCHNGTHMDAPLHIDKDGADIAALPLEAMVGPCTVADVRGAVTAETARALVGRCQKRLLLRTAGDGYLTADGATTLAQGGIVLLGVDAISLSTPEEELAVHRCFLGKGIPVLEGLALSQVAPGDYTLLALPLKLAGADGAPVRAVLCADGAESCRK